MLRTAIPAIIPTAIPAVAPLLGPEEYAIGLETGLEVWLRARSELEKDVDGSLDDLEVGRAEFVKGDVGMLLLASA